MKITTLYVYPIKGLRGIELKSAQIGPQGIEHDRRFMLYEVHSTTGELKKIQVDSHPRCALFEQQFARESEDGVPGRIIVRFHGSSPHGSETAEENKTIEVPLTPDWSSLEKVDVVLHGSPASAYRMGDPYDSWFGRHFGVRTILVYLGDGRRAVLGKTLPPTPVQEPQRQGWISSLTSYITGSQVAGTGSGSGPWITFADVAPLLVTSEMSLRDVRDRLLGGLPLEMFKFRPNIVVDGEGESAWAEDFWAELSIGAVGHGDRRRVLQLTGNCVRCISLNVDYNTGKPAEGELGNVLKRLMKERRVDKGAKWSPVFGRYAFLDSRHARDITVSVGDDVEVTRRNTERSVWDWPAS
ncbi:uncharacterized protein P884DRAFT_215855 [Thermothelomyces heterothallicus CBS 202.75]|uniref:uncharacterized protein n=1 Tax=Thermothelomyces heterothallicus CBS 202.75 TaxID=1149848 RepID=UPI003743E4FF